ncbi:hypothetical protein FA09DRAFT_357233 [Tilletiopsis washingtonensis]|uniref:CRAL-TRIO domain-containing protein n=1 Tax=Tilletiopsis washingtonensis TaxID=58919 RepID=A0A316ZA65_9BASI|nr:hypothetical protein FA09DRAFT_357233 [Tilletiopsis washingtonensis]PWN98449.1 hypothetical protein FA09DRAFT_357233 [Tilletiopsis washingtonensis]
MAAMPELDRESSRLSSGSKSRTSRARNAAHRVSYRGASKLKQVASHARARTEGDKGDAAAEAQAANAQIKGFEGVFPVPAAGCRPKPPAALSPSQQVALDGMLSHFRDTKQFPTSLKPDAEQREANDWEKLRLLSRESLLRYLRASKWDLSTAKKRLTDTIAWRREFGVDELVDEEMSEEAKCGKETVLGYDKHARPLHYMHPHRNDTKETPRQMQFAVWILERSVDLMPPGSEQLALLINFDHRSRNPTSIANAKLMLYILQNHYVERLGVALCINVPWIFKAFWSGIQPFIDPVTKSKCKFDEAIKDEVPLEQLSADFGGELDPKYNHDAYWPELVAVCKQRRDDMLRRFRESCNSEVGASEWVILGGDDAEAPFNKKDLHELAEGAEDKQAVGLTQGGEKAPVAHVDDEKARQAREEAIAKSNERVEAATPAAGLGPDDTTENPLEKFTTAGLAPASQAAAAVTPGEKYVTPMAQPASHPIEREFEVPPSPASASSKAIERVATEDTAVSSGSRPSSASGKAKAFFGSLKRSNKGSKNGKSSKHDMHHIAAEISAGLGAGAAAAAAALQKTAKKHEEKAEAAAREAEAKKAEESTASAVKADAAAAPSAATAAETSEAPQEASDGATQDPDAAAAAAVDGSDSPAAAAPTPASKPVSVLLFASAREAAGTAAMSITLPSASLALADLPELLLAEQAKSNKGDAEALKRILSAAQWSVDQEMVDEEQVKTTLLKGGEEVAPITPVSGG